VLGSDAPADVAMEKVRLVALGCRLVADDDRRLASLYFVDPDTATVLVLAKTWTGERRNGADLGKLFASSRMAITDLVQGELVTRAARRKANGALDLSASRSMQSTLLPAGGGWDALPEPILVRDLRAHARRLAAAPPAVVAPRLIGHGVAVVAIARVDRVAVSADGLELIAVVRDAADNALDLALRPRGGVPGRRRRAGGCAGRRPALRRRRARGPRRRVAHAAAGDRHDPADRPRRRPAPHRAARRRAARRTPRR
jgi:hypothetical protein